jgi:predicted GIY-YIG superfamily endonuclease
MTVYLIHFSEPYHHAQHYLGSAKSVSERCREHAAGSGARLMQVIGEAGIEWQVARTWPGGRAEERQLKRRHNSRRLCPICQREVTACMNS